MRQPSSKSSPQSSEAPALESTVHAVPTFIATDLLEKLIADRDAHAVDRVVMAARRH